VAEPLIKALEAGRVGRRISQLGQFTHTVVVEYVANRNIARQDGCGRACLRDYRHGSCRLLLDITKSVAFFASPYETPLEGGIVVRDYDRFFRVGRYLYNNTQRIYAFFAVDVLVYSAEFDIARVQLQIVVGVQC